MSGRIFTGDNPVKGDIFSIVMSIENISFPKSLARVHEILGLDFNSNISYKNKKNEYDPLEIFKRFATNEYKPDELNTYSEDVLDKDTYLKMPHITLIREGIVPQVQNEFDVMFDTKSRRILFPHRHWSTGKIIGIMGRTTVECYDLFDIQKYLPLIAFSKSLNLYGLYRNYREIQEMGYVIVVEGEKSVLKLKSLGYANGVALGGHSLSDEQARILIGLNVDIVFALDDGIDEQESIDMCKRLNRIRNTYYIFDKSNPKLLSKKSAPIDCGVRTFKTLLDKKIKVWKGD